MSYVVLEVSTIEMCLDLKNLKKQQKLCIFLWTLV